MRLFLACIAFSLPAAAQTPAPAPAPERPAAKPETPAAAQPAEPRRPLILRLDEIDGPRPSFGASQGERYQSNQLPTLGGDARMPDYQLRTNPYPHSSENLQ